MNTNGSPCNALLPKPASHQTAILRLGAKHQLLILLCWALATVHSEATTITWTNLNGGSWTTAANWDPNLVPSSPLDIVQITNAGTYTVILDTALTVSGITLGLPGKAGIPTLAWEAGILKGCDLWVASQAVLSIRGAADKQLIQSTIHNSGTITYAGTGRLLAMMDYFGQSVLITNLPGALIEIQNDSSLAFMDPGGYGSAGYWLCNAGTLRKSAGTATNRFDPQLNFINNGTVELIQGALQFPNGFSSSGTFALSTNTAVNLDGGTFTFGTTSLKSGPGYLLVDDGDVTLNGTLPSLNWTGGRLLGSSFTVATNAVLTISGSADKYLLRSTLNNAGNILWTGTGQLLAAMDGYGQSVLITNLAGALFDIQNNSTIGFFDPSGFGFAGYWFHNAGTLRKSAGTSTNAFASQCQFVNTGNILLQLGAIVFPGFTNTGTLTVQPGALAVFPLGFANNGTFDLAANAQAHSTGGACSFGPGSQLTGSGQWVVPSGDVTLTGTIPNLTWLGGRLVGSSFTVASNAWLSIGGTTDKQLVQSTLNNAGTITYAGTGRLLAMMDYFGQSVLITNLPGALIEIQNDSSLAFMDPGGYGSAGYWLCNAGTLRKSAGTGTNRFDPQLNFINNGKVELIQGALQFPNGFSSSGTFALSTNTAVNLDGGTFTFGTTSLKSGPGYLLVDDGDVALNGTLPSLNWTGGRLLGSSFTVATNAVLTIGGSADKYLLRSTLNNAGNILWTGTGQLLAAMDGYGQSVLITNLAGALFDIQNNSTIGFFDPSGFGFAGYWFHNAGTLRKSAGSVTNAFASQCQFVNTGNILLQLGAIVFPGFTNTGTLTVQSGALAVFPLGFANNGTFDLAANAQAHSTGGSCSFGPGSQLTGSGQWVVPSGDVTLTGTIPNLTWLGGRLVRSSFTVASNAWLSIGGTTDKQLVQSTLNNAGTITYAGTGRLLATVDYFGQSVLITNLAGALLDIQNDSSLAFTDPSGYGTAGYWLCNAGTLRKSAGTGTNRFDPQLNFINNGTVELIQGALQFPNGFSSSGTFALSTNTAVNLDGGTFTFGTTSLKSGSGYLLVDDGDVTLNGTLPSLNWTGGRLLGSSFTVATNAVLTISGSADKYLLRSTLNNAGNILWTGTGQLLAAMDGYGQSVLITNLAGALFDIQNDSTMGFSDPSGFGFVGYWFHNAGTLRKSAGTAATAVASQCTFVNAGRTELKSGTLHVGSAFIQMASGVLGLRDLNPTVIQPRLEVVGQANLSGVLELALLPGVAAVGQSLAVITFDNLTGGFAQTAGIVLGGGLWLRLTQNVHDLTLTVEGPPKVLSLQTSGEGFKLAWQGEPGVAYQVLASTNLHDWQLVLSTNSPNGFFQYVDPDFPARKRRFYQTIIQ